MENELQAIQDTFLELWMTIMSQAELMLLPSRQVQIGLLIICFVGAFLLRRSFAPRMHEWMRTLEGRPKWQLRTLVVIHKRLQLIFFVLLAWLAVSVMAQISPFPSRRYVLVLIATIATAWLLVSFAARLVKNRSLRRIVTWGLWIYVTLYYLGLVEVAADVLDGLAISIGEFRLSALTTLNALVVLAALFTFARLAAHTASDRIRDNEDISPSMRVLAVKFVQILFFGAAFFIGLRAVGVDLSGLAFLSGAIGLGLGFGLQKVVSNLVSGVIILLDKSIKPGDVISLGDTFGWINSLGARYVSVVTRDGREWLIPNEDLITGQVVNWSHSNKFVRLDIYFGTSYNDNPHEVRRLAIEAAQSVDRVLKHRPTVCHIVGFGDSSVDYILRFWIDDPTGGLTNIRGNVYLALWDVFQANGISIPFPQREVTLLDGGAEKAEPTSA